MWYDIYAEGYPKNENGTPYRGWNKLGFGFTQGLFTNTRRSCMVAEFPLDHTPGFHKIALYINDKNGDWDATIDTIIVQAGVKYSGRLSWYRYEVVLELWKTDEPTKGNWVSLKLTRSNWLPLRGLHAWHGGKYTAPQKRSFKATYNYVK